MKIGTQDIAGTTVEIHADTYGRWTIRLPVKSENEDTLPLGNDEVLDKALGQARTKLAKSRVKVAVPFVIGDGEHGIAYGVHASNRDVLVRIDGGKAQRIGKEIVFKGETPKAVTDRIAQLEREHTAIRWNLRELVDEWSMDLGAAVAEAIAAKQAEQEDT